MEKEKILSEDFLCSEILNLDDDKSDMNELINCTVEPLIEKIELINVKEGINISGQVSSGKRIIIFIIFKIHIKYTSCKNNKIVLDTTQKSDFLYLDSPKVIKQSRVEDLYRKKRFTVNVFIDKLNYKKINERTLELKIFGKISLCS